MVLIPGEQTGANHTTLVRQLTLYGSLCSLSGLLQLSSQSIDKQWHLPRCPLLVCLTLKHVTALTLDELVKSHKPLKHTHPACLSEAVVLYC